MVTSSQPPLDDRAHLSVLDGVRALSILAVLATHMLPLGPPSWQINATTGPMGMSAFFCLSGFLITSALWQNQNIGTFLARRLARIVPLILLVSVLYTLIWEYRPDSFVAINLYIVNYWHDALSPKISPMWSVAMEMQFYVAIALAVLLLGRKGLFLIPLAAFFITGYRIWHGVGASIETLFRVDEILSGGMLALIWVHRGEAWAQTTLNVLRRLFWPLLVLWVLSCSPMTGALGYPRPYLTAALVGSTLTIRDGWLHHALSHYTMRYIALISFALYVWHSPFRHGWFDPESRTERYLIRRPLGIAASFLLAHLSTFYFEKPITEKVRDWTKTRKRVNRP